MISVAQVDQLLAAASIVDLLAALGPADVMHGGKCPRCGRTAWAVDTLNWVCQGRPAEWTPTGPGLNRGRHHEGEPGHRGTIYELRRVIAENPQALAHLAGGALIGEPLPDLEGAA